MSKRVICVLPEEVAEEIVAFITQKGGRIENITNQKIRTVLTGPEVIVALSKTNKACVRYADNSEIVFQKEYNAVNVVLFDGHKRKPKYYLFVYSWNTLQAKLQAHVSVEVSLAQNKFRDSTSVVTTYKEAAEWLEWDWRKTKKE